MNSEDTDLPVRFQKFFTGVAALSLLTYCGALISQYINGSQMEFDSRSVWVVVSSAMMVAVPLVLLGLGARMSRGAWWQRLMRGSWCASGAILTETILLALIGLIDTALPFDYTIIGTSLSILVIIAWAGVLWLFRAKPQLWGRRYVAYTAGIVGAAVLFDLFAAVSMIHYSAYSSWTEWVPMLIAHLVVIVLSLVAYFTLSAVSRMMRLFRVVLVMMAAFMATYSMSDVVSIVAQLSGGMDYTSGSYLVASIALPVVVYVLALWLARPVRKGGNAHKVATAEA